MSFPERKKLSAKILRREYENIKNYYRNKRNTSEILRWSGKIRKTLVRMVSRCSPTEPHFVSTWFGYRICSAIYPNVRNT